MKYLKFFYMLCVIGALSCSGDDASSTDSSSNSNGNGNGESPGVSTWLIPQSEIRDGGPGKDGIPSIDNPQFSTVAESNSQINDSDIVIAIKIGDDVRIYPHYIMDYHEIVNDQINSETITISYCPLTGTAFAWESDVAGSFTTFGVSGLLYNSNLILYDRETDSNWSQILELCVNGESIGEEPIKRGLIEAEWGTIKAMFPEALVLNADTGFERPYGSYPYGSYLDDDDFFIFTPSIINTALPFKSRVLAIRSEDNSKVYRFSSFSNGSVVKDSFESNRYLIVGNSSVMNAFRLSGFQNNLEFTYSYNGSEAFFSDNSGNVYNIFGEVIEGPNTGTKLQSANAFMSMWFATAAFFPDPIIFE